MSDAPTALSSNGPVTMIVNKSPRYRWVSEARYWSLQEEQRLTHLREVERLSPSAIGKVMGRTRQSVQAKLRRMGVCLPETLFNEPGVRLSRDQSAQLRKMWAAGIGLEDAARRVGTSEGTAGRLYREFSKQEREALQALNFGPYIGVSEMMVIAGSICGVPPRAITGASRLKPNVCARMAIAKALRDRGCSMSQIGRKLGRSDHSVVVNYFKNFDAYCSIYPEMRRAYDAIKQAEARAAERLAA